MLTPYTLNCHGRLVTLDHCHVMGIVNITDDSFYAASRTPADAPAAIRERVQRVLAEGADIIDLGACSTRPGSTPVAEAEEMRRLEVALTVVRETAPEAIVSVDTFRANVARLAVEDFGADIINDVSSGEQDPQMLRTVARLGVPYVLTHSRSKACDAFGTPMYDNIAAEVIEDLARRAHHLHNLGVADVIVDPGFGFGKTAEQGFHLLRDLASFAELHLPLLVGLSRKSMIYRTLDTTPADALAGTTALHAYAVWHGAHLLRVHDVKAAADTINIIQTLQHA